jgi:hypothetical protein
MTVSQVSTAMKEVYFIKPIDMAGPIKIGCSIDHAQRAEHFCRWSPLPLELIGSVPGTHQDEAFLHNCFIDAHSHGEWFHPIPRLVSIIPLILKHGMKIARQELKPQGSLRVLLEDPEVRERRAEAIRMSWADRRRCPDGRQQEELS